MCTSVARAAGGPLAMRLGARSQNPTCAAATAALAEAASPLVTLSDTASRLVQPPAAAASRPADAASPGVGARLRADASAHFQTLVAH